jgi:hypothetical protein
MSTARLGCQQCKRKALLKVTCKCDLVVCFDCRYPELHNCKFNYQKEAKDQLTKNNPIVVSEKLDKI